MDIMGIIAASAVVGGIGLVIGILLSIAGEIFKTEGNEKEIQIRSLLPGANCGACGYPGCGSLAKAIVKGEAGADACPVGKASVAAAVAKVL